MGRLDIIEKLNRFLGEHNPLSEECHVVYLMVEIRKILDHERDTGHKNEYPLLRFYSDWIVHTSKDKITIEMERIINEVFRDIKLQIENPNSVRSMTPVMQFAYKQQLEIEMKKFLGEHQLSTSVTGAEKWVHFVSLLVKVLENQPIKNPTEDVIEFCFYPAAPRCVQGMVTFKQPIKGKAFNNSVMPIRRGAPPARVAGGYPVRGGREGKHRQR